jgi:hypothetical protein
MGVASAMSRVFYQKESVPIPIVQEAGWSIGPVWTGAENLPPPPDFDPQTTQTVASQLTG